jgi:cysteinyl-tRNA synthetase
MVVIVLFLPGCPPDDPVDDSVGDYAGEMRTLVQSISAYAKSAVPGFLIVPHGGEALLTADGSPTGFPSIAYVNSIDGQAHEDVFYGYLEDDGATPAPERDAILAMLDWAESMGIQVLVIDHCSTCSRVDTSYAWNAGRGYVSTATCRASNAIPAYPAQPYNVNANDVQSLADARNLLYFLDPCQFGTCPAYLWALSVNNFDLLVVDSCFKGQILAADEVELLKTKANGGKRLVLAHLNIGEAESQRAYWQPTWQPGAPAWLVEQGAGSGRYLVDYWHAEWKAILLGNPNACIDQILAAGFDGVYLDGIEAYQRFE